MIGGLSKSSYAWHFLLCGRQDSKELKYLHPQIFGESFGHLSIRGCRLRTTHYRVSLNRVLNLTSK